MLVGVAVQDGEDTVRAVARRYGLSYPLGLDPDGRVSLNYGVTTLPTVRVDPSGRVLRRWMGPVAGEADLTGLLERLRAGG